MTAEKLNRLWLLATALLILIIITTLIIVLIKHDQGQPLTISPPQNPHYTGQVYIDGAVNRPGALAFGPEDSVGGLIEASGGVQADADLAAVHLYVPSSTIPPGFQKIDINRAEGWLLQVLPGIGEIKAQAILDYRQQIGHFDNISQLTEVPGITTAVFDKIKAYITTGDQ
jgi:competence protein ComEA